MRILKPSRNSQISTLVIRFSSQIWKKSRWNIIQVSMSHTNVPLSLITKNEHCTHQKLVQISSEPAILLFFIEILICWVGVRIMFQTKSQILSSTADYHTSNSSNDCPGWHFKLFTYEILYDKSLGKACNFWNGTIADTFWKTQLWFF